MYPRLIGFVGSKSNNYFLFCIGGELSDSARKANPNTNPKKIHEYFEPASPARAGYIHSERPIISPPYGNPVSFQFATFEVLKPKFSEIFVYNQSLKQF